MTGHPDDPAELRERMVDRLLTDDGMAVWSTAVAPWRSALATVPRHEFIPDTVWTKNPRHWPALLPLRRDDDPTRWLELTYGIDAVITQVDDGHPDSPGLAGAMQTSSASAPDIVAIMLAELDAHPGHRVLEIGTGDGALGYPPNARYDRVIATAAVHSIPYSWVEQTRPGGRIVLPWANSYTGALVALTVDEHGSASGGIVGESSFMWLRAQRERRAAVDAIIGDNEDRAAVHLTQLHPYSVGGELGARFAIGQRVHRCQWRYWPYEQRTGTGVFWLLDFGSRSWAKLTHTTPDASDGEFPVHQHGPRRLWDEIHAAHQWWVAHGKPDVDRWRFTVTRQAQRIDLT